MQLTSSFLEVLQQLAFVFTAPTFRTFVQIATGWIFSQRHRYVTEVIFSSGNVGNGHWSRFHRFFSHAAWDLDGLSLFIAKLVVRVFTPGATLLWAVDDTLCRKRGLTLYGAGMHHDPLISSRAKPLVSWGALTQGFCYRARIVASSGCYQSPEGKRCTRRSAKRRRKNCLKRCGSVISEPARKARARS